MSAHLQQLFARWNQAWISPPRKSTRIRQGRRTVATIGFAIASEIERLELRPLLSAVSPLADVEAEPTSQVVQAATTGPTNDGYTPAEMQTAYGFNQISLSSGANGTGQTIAIVDAYNDPTIQSDLQAFDSAYGLANPPSLTVVSQTGSTTNLPTTDSTKNWEVEESLDVEWAHALAPGAKILLVEANSASYSDLMTAVQYAAKQPGVSVVSMSWGGGEFSTESAYDSYFTTPSGHQGVTFIASTGDSAAPGGFPAYSPNVLAVGGTALTLSSTGSYISETGWSDSGGGISQYESQPSYQSGIVTQTSTNRAAPDVAFDAAPSTGVPVYDSFSFGTTTPWVQVGGTSLGAPSWAALVSIVDQARAQNGLGSLDGATQTLPMLYKLDQTTPSAFHDVTSGSNGFSAGPGYDLVTGLGSPVANQIVSGLEGTATPSPSSKLVIGQQPTTGTAGQTLGTITVDVENQSGQIVTTDSSTVTISISSGPGSFKSGSTLTATAVNGVATFSNLALDTAGSYTLVASDTGDSSATSSGVAISAGQASKVVFQQQPTTGAAGSTLGTITAAIEDQFGNVVTSNKSTVKISVASGPGGFSSGSTTSVAAVSGIATFKNLTLGTGGAYTLSVTDGTLTGATSASFSIAAGLTAPQNVTVGSVTSTTAVLSWNAVPGTQGYRVYQVVGSKVRLLGTVSSTSTSVEITGLTGSSKYSFEVAAYNSKTVDYSKAVSFTTLAASSVHSKSAAQPHASITVEPNGTNVAGLIDQQAFFDTNGLNSYFSTVHNGWTNH